MNVHELKIKALLEGLEAQNIEKFIREAKVGDYRNYGKAYISAVREKIKEKELLFITEDGVEVFNDEPYIILKRNYEKVETVAHKNGDYREGVIRFKHESNADEYILKNKPLFSYEDFMKWGNVPYERVIMQLAKERAGQ